MRKLFRTAAAVATLPALSMAAGAAEVGARPTAYEFAPVYVAPPFSWTGFYIGGNVGGAWDKRNLTDSLFGLNLSAQNDRGAFMGGGQLGFNYQLGSFVLGVEADFEGIATTNSPSTPEFLDQSLARSRSLRTAGGWRPWPPGSGSRTIPGCFMARPAALGSATTTSPSSTRSPMHRFRAATTPAPAGWRGRASNGR